MTRSNSYNYNVTGSDIMTEARELISSIDIGGTISSAESTSDLRTMNMMLKALQSKGIGLWLNKECWLFLQGDTIKYLIGPSGDHCAVDAVKTELAAAAAASATSITVDSITGFGNTFDRNGIALAQTPGGAVNLTLAGALVTSSVAYLTSQRKIVIYAVADESARTFTLTGTNGIGTTVTETITGPTAGASVYSTYTYSTITTVAIDGAGTGDIEVGQVGDPIGIELDGGTIQWTYPAAAVTTTTINPIVTALTGAAAADNHVYTYATETQRPTEIVEARLVNASANERPLRIAGRLEYMALSDKTTEATPNLIYYDKQLDNGALYVWPEPSDVQEYIKFTGRFPIQDIDATANNFEVGQEWFEALAWNLAWRIAPKYGKKIDADFRLSAEQMLQDAIVFDAENTSIVIQIGRR